MQATMSQQCFAVNGLEIVQAPVAALLEREHFNYLLRVSYCEKSKRLLKAVVSVHTKNCHTYPASTRMHCR